MITALARKARRVGSDSTLRRWIVGAMVGRFRRPEKFEPHCPPYLTKTELPDWQAIRMAESGKFKELPSSLPNSPMTINLAGKIVILSPDDRESLFSISFTDTEQLLALHRFAWVPVLGEGIDPAWVDFLWRAWMSRHGEPDRSWAWHPYTAAERIVNVLDFTRRFGLPGDREATLDMLVRHARPIVENLEYFGDHDTSNHLSNNGRGLYRLGLALNLPAIAALGRQIVIAEAKRIFSPSGVLREGSSHYHLLLTRNYIDVWLAALRHRMPEADELKSIAEWALSALSQLLLPGGIPLIGDISPDCPPDYLAGLFPCGDVNHGWCGNLSASDRRALAEIKLKSSSMPPRDFERDGWIRATFGSWNGLWHVSPGGWVPMPGHGHQDLGSFELHWDGEPLFVDPGRGAYGEQGEAAYYVSAAAHNSLTIDDVDPYPANKPYYDDEFRRIVCGPSPRVEKSDIGLTIVHSAYRRMTGVGNVSRVFDFSDRTLTISDHIEGRSRRTLKRSLHTPLTAKSDGANVTLDGPNGRFVITADCPIEISDGKRWTAYGVMEPSTVLTFVRVKTLPVVLTLTIKKVG